MLRRVVTPRRVAWWLIRSMIAGSVVAALAACGGNDPVREACDSAKSDLTDEQRALLDEDELVEWCVQLGEWALDNPDEAAGMAAEIGEAREGLAEAKARLERDEPQAEEDPAQAIPGQGLKEAGNIAATRLEDAIAALKQYHGGLSSETAAELAIREAVDAVDRFLATEPQQHQQEAAAEAEAAALEAVASMCDLAESVDLGCPARAYVLLEDGG